MLTVEVIWPYMSTAQKWCYRSTLDSVASGPVAICPVAAQGAPSLFGQHSSVYKPTDVLNSTQLAISLQSSPIYQCFLTPFHIPTDSMARLLAVLLLASFAVATIGAHPLRMPNHRKLMSGEQLC
jgi:hypothetical protein